MNRSVDNYRAMRVTSRFLWIESWITQKPEMAGRGLLRDARGGSRNVFTVGNGHHLGATPGTWEEPGDRYLARVPGPGGRRVASAGSGQPASQRGEAGQGPSISYMEGPCLILTGRNISAGTTTTPATAGKRYRDGPRS